MKFQTDFSTTQKETNNYDRWTLTGFPRMWSHLATGFALDFDTEIFRSPLRSFKITWGDALIVDGENPRPNIQIYDLMPYQEHWISQWFYLPADFKLKRWMVITEPLDYKYIPKDEMYDVTSKAYGIVLGGDQTYGTGSIKIQGELKLWHFTTPTDYYDDYPYVSSKIIIPRGEWINLRHHVKYGADGILETWIQSKSIPLTKLADYRGDTASYGGDRSYYTTVPFDHYKRIDEPVSTVYFDDYRLDEYNFFDELPPQPPQPPSKSLVGPAVLFGAAILLGQ